MAGMEVIYTYFYNVHPYFQQSREKHDIAL